MRFSIIWKCAKFVSNIMKKIGTHDGKCHADDVLACFMLKQLPEYIDAQVIRTRDPAVLADCDIVVDVGATFDVKTKRFDHHQRDFSHTMRTLEVLPFDTKLSSAGLIYAYYGQQLIKQISGLDGTENDPKIQILFHKIYEQFMEEIDAVDNGVPQTNEIPRYAVTSTLSRRVGNLGWTDEQSDMDIFISAMELAGSELVDKIKYYSLKWLPARDVIKKAVDSRFELDPSGQIVFFDEGVPWKDHFFSIEPELPEESARILYSLHGSESDWRVQCIPATKLEPFNSRLPLPESWRGLRDEKLVEQCGIERSFFCHATGFIGGNRTKEGVLAMARKSLDLQSAKTANGK